MKKILTFGIILLFIGTSIPSTGTIVEKSSTLSFDGNTLYVGGAGLGNYSRIQGAIDNASDGDTVFVYDDSSPYYENVEVDKSINLIGEDRNTTIIDGNGSGDVVYISTVRVNISGFTIQNIGGWDAGIEIRSNYNTITGNNIISHNNYGIMFEDSSNNTIKGNNISNNGCGIILKDSSSNTVSGNIISNNSYGIMLKDSSNNTITGNTITSNNDNGIYLYRTSNNNIITINTISNNEDGIVFVGSSNITVSGNIISNNSYGIYFYYSSNITVSGNIISNNSYGIVFCTSNITVSGNIISNNSYGIYFYCSSNNNIITSNNISNNDCGIYLDWYSSSNTIKGNTISNNEDGIKLDSSSNNNIITGNTISNNHDGIYIWDSSSNTIKGNTISNNDCGIYLEEFSSSNTIYHNNFINNTQNAYDECSNTWDNDYPSGGNYWDGYIITHVDGDGIGNTPYNIPGGDNQDLYPLMHPFELYYILNIFASSQVDEDTEFTITVKSLGGTVIPDALVEFRDEVKVTDLNGIAQFTAPEVEEDTLFWINATKEGYTNDSETILVKYVPEFKTTIIFGRITNLTTVGDYTTFEAVNIRCMTFVPFRFLHCTSGELITTSKYYFGLLTPSFIFAATPSFIFAL